MAQCFVPVVRWSTVRALVVLSTLTWLAAACSDDSNDAGSQPSAADAAATSATDAAEGDADVGAICASCGGCEETKIPTSRNHVLGVVDYTDPPPMGGDHNECWTTWGVHDPAALPERWVHNLEHGGVVFLYNCPGGCAADVAALKALIDGKPQTLLTAYQDMPKKFAVVSWGHRIVTDCVDQAAFTAFYKAHVNQGPELITDGPPDGCPPGDQL